MIKQFLMLLVKSYKLFISPLLGNNCRFYPTCSEYTHQAIHKHGAIKGIFLGTKRVLKCNPFFEGGIDYVPDKFEVKIKWKQKD